MQVPRIYPHFGSGIRKNFGVDGEQLAKVLARNARKRMDELGIKAQEKVEGVKQSTLSRVLLADGTPTLRTLAIVAKALDCQAWELLVDEEATREAAYRKILGKKP